MTGNSTLDLLLAIQGAISAIASLIALLAPKGSKVGIVAGKVGADLKGQTVGARKPPSESEDASG
jgi:hypothetical protein